jgi:hypothetical protein
MPEFARLLAGLALTLAPAVAVAETAGVYHPYVNLHEREIEYGLTYRGVGDSALALQRASIAYAWTDRLSTELYLLSEFPSHGDTRARAVELEARYELTEQGEYASDWGLVFEAEFGDDRHRNEVAAGVLWEKELGHRWVGAANALVEYEFGSEVENEFEAAFRGQLRYLHRAAFEPALELYLDDQDYAAGPAILGAARLGPGRQLRWELGLLFGIDGQTPDRSVRANLEFEF